MDLQAYRYAMRLLGRQDYSERKIKKKMLAKNFSSQEIEQVITLLKEENYVNEKRFACHEIIKLITKGYAPPLIQIFLKRQEISAPSEQLEKWIHLSYQEMKLTQEDQIKKMIQLRKKRHQKKDHQYNVRLLRHLLSRGHDRELCETILDIEF